MTARPIADELVELWGMTTMPTENVRFTQSYVDPKVGRDGKAFCSAIVALLVDDPTVFADLHRTSTGGSSACGRRGVRSTCMTTRARPNGRGRSA